VEADPLPDLGDGGVYGGLLFLALCVEDHVELGVVLHVPARLEAPGSIDTLDNTQYRGIWVADTPLTDLGDSGVYGSLLFLSLWVEDHVELAVVLHVLGRLEVLGSINMSDLILLGHDMGIERDSERHR
jgi:hypothetical protein